ncbi:MAG: MFS transporter [Lentisphaeria bacterium]
MKFSRYDFAAYSLFMAYAAGSVIIPIALCHIAVSLDFPLESGGLSSGGALQVGRSLSMIPAMLLSGFLAGKWGLKKILGIAAVFMGVGIFLAGLAPFYSMLFFALSIAGIGEGLIEALATPFVQKLHKKDPGQYINIAHSFWSVGVFLCVLGAGWLLLAGYSWRLPILITALLSLIPIYILMKEDSAHSYPEDIRNYHRHEIWDQTTKILRCPHFWLFFAAMFVAGGGEFGLTFWVASYIQLEFSATAWIAGIGTACFAGGMFIGRSGSGLFVKERFLQHLIVFTALFGTAISCFIPLIHSDWIIQAAQAYPFLKIFTQNTVLFPLLFLAGLGSAPFWPSVQSYSAIRLPKLDTTMLFIILSCAGIPGCGLITWFMGIIGNHYGLRASFILIPICYLTLAILISADWFFYRRQRRQQSI